MHIDPTLESMTAVDPNARTPVVVTLKRGTAESASSLGVPEAQEVAPGIFTAMLTGDEIKQLSRQGQVEAIEADQSVDALGG